MKEKVIYVCGCAVNTDSCSVAARVAARAYKSRNVRGKVRIGTRYVKWCTVQQYEYHGGFDPAGVSGNSYIK